MTTNSKVRVSLLSPEFILGTASAMQVGVDKYAQGDYLNGDKLSKYYEKVQRHVLAYWSGEDNDPESGLCHLYHAAADLNIMLEIIRKHPDRDDREKA